LAARFGGSPCSPAVALFALGARAAYPDHAIKLIVPVPPGGGVDLLSRAIGAKMQQSMGQPVVIENKAGASAAIGTEALAKSPPDGYTIMMGYSAHATNPIFVAKLPYDTNKDFRRRSRTSATSR
jgi:tripartite-type tricarboxylate transporter receptor subunit TctC